MPNDCTQPTTTISSQIKSGIITQIANIGGFGIINSNGTLYSYFHNNNYIFFRNQLVHFFTCTNGLIQSLPDDLSGRSLAFNIHLQRKATSGTPHNTDGRLRGTKTDLPPNTRLPILPTQSTFYYFINDCGDVKEVRENNFIPIIWDRYNLTFNISLDEWVLNSINNDNDWS